MVIGVGTSVFSNPKSPAVCKGSGGNNWLGDWLETSPDGFSVRSAVGYDGSASNPSTLYLATYYAVKPNPNRPQAYVAGTIVKLPDMTLLNTADIFNSTTCFSYPDVTANSRGDLGLAIGFGSSSNGSGGPAQSFVGISDDYSRGTTRGFFGTVFLCAPATENPTRWGDYLTARVQEPVDVAFTAATFGVESGAGKVHVCEFMRKRYQQAYTDRATK